MEFIKTDNIEDILDLHKQIFEFDFPIESYYKKRKAYELLIYLYIEEGECVGYSIIVDQSEIKNLYAWYGGVVPCRQGCGINSLFLDELIKEATNKKYDSVTLATTNSRPNMIILAVRKGFKIYDLKKRDYGEGNKIYFKYLITYNE